MSPKMNIENVSLLPDIIYVEKRKYKVKVADVNKNNHKDYQRDRSSDRSEIVSDQ